MSESASGAVASPLQRESVGVVSHSPSAARVAAAPEARLPSLRFRSIAELRRYKHNARTHSDAQIEQVAASLVEFGWTMPILEDAEGIVAGHARLEAATWLYENLGEQIHFPDGTPIPIGMVPTLPCDGWSDDKRRAYVIADNKLALNAGWDTAMLGSEFSLLRDNEFDLSLLGFSESELAIIFPKAPDEFPSFDGLIATEHQCPKCGYTWSGASRTRQVKQGDD